MEDKKNLDDNRARNLLERAQIQARRQEARKVQETNQQLGFSTRVRETRLNKTV